MVIKKNLSIMGVAIVCLALAAGCAGKDKHQTREKLMKMSDKQLIDHYEMLEMRMVGIDRAREQSQEGNQALRNSHYPPDYQNQLKHLHIGDGWNRIIKEKKLTRIEMRTRGIAPP